MYKKFLVTDNATCMRLQYYEKVGLFRATQSFDETCYRYHAPKLSYKNLLNKIKKFFQKRLTLDLLQRLH
ncbi:MAG: hypothetical protein FWG64_01720 [Firmicutes bacterium]|nr:hypothetical protein [Bacillota bacterium]